MLTNEDKETLRYLKQSSDALKRDAVRLIELQDQQICNLLGIISNVKNELEKPSLFSKIIGWFK